MIRHGFVFGFVVTFAVHLSVAILYVLTTCSSSLQYARFAPFVIHCGYTRCHCTRLLHYIWGCSVELDSTLNYIFVRPLNCAARSCLRSYLPSSYPGSLLRIQYDVTNTREDRPHRP